MTQKILEAINQWFKRVGGTIITLRWGIIVAVVVLNIFAFIGIRNVQIDTSNDSWFLADDPLTIAKAKFEEVFGNNEYASVLVEADDVFASDILSMIRELGEELEENVPYADDVLSLTDLEFTRGTEEGMEIGDIVPEDIPTDSQALEEIRTLAFSKPLLVNRLFSDDRRQAWIFLRLATFPDDWEVTGAEDPEQAVGRTVLEIVNQEKYQAYTLRPSGVPVITYQEQAFFAREGARLLVIFFVIALIVLFVFLRTIRGVLIPMTTFFSAAIWVFGAMGWLGIKVDSTVMTLPIFLGLAVSIGYSIHIFNFFHRSFRTTGARRTAVLHAVEETGWPILFTAITTIVALVSFYFVPITTVRWMGLSSAAIIIATYVLVMSLTPALLSFGKNRRIQTAGVANVRMSDRIERIFTRFSHWVLNHPKSIMVVFVVLVVVFLGGLSRMSIGLGYEQSYGLRIPFVKLLHDVGHSKIGSIYSYVLTLTFDEQDIVKDPGVLQRFETLIADVQELPLTKRGSSLLDVIKDLNQVMHADNAVYYRIPESKELVAQLLLLYEMSDGTEQEHWVDYDYTTLRLMVEATTYDAAEMERELHYLQQRAQHLFPEATFGIVGSVVQSVVAQNYIAKGEIVSFFIALVAIGILMMLVFRSVKTGLIGMIPNLAPVIVTGGIMGYFDIPLDMITMTVLPILLGLAVDDTIHFISHSKLEFLRTGSYREGIQNTFRTVGKAIFMTSFIIIAAYSVYMTSVAALIVHIGMLIAVGIISALLADYCITPILVNWLKPFGEERVHGEEPIWTDSSETLPVAVDAL